VYDKLRQSRRLDAVQSGCTAMSIVTQGDLMVIANVGDSRFVLGTASDDVPSRRPYHRPPEV
jgi:serine/threonine protein phosphatase PrpC